MKMKKNDFQEADSHEVPYVSFRVWGWGLLNFQIMSLGDDGLKLRNHFLVVKIWRFKFCIGWV